MNTETISIIGRKAKVIKGNAARGVTKHTTIQITDVTPLGPDYSHMVKVSFVILRSGVKMSFYARHQNRLNDLLINLNDGNPFHKIQISLI